MITVEDDGPGWPEADRDRVLQPYVTTKAAGTGLGLSLVQRTVFQHGGALHLEDRPGGGARVTLELPRSGRAAAPPEARIEDAS
jgi:two-component system nitrogen regulation sensor histidine kinase NtrY